MTTNKNVFFIKINEAFANNDTDFIAENITEDIQWTMIGTPTIRGKSEFLKAIAQVEKEGNMDVKINQIITHGNTAAVEGIMKVADRQGSTKTYAFCDLYKLNGFKNGKIKTLTSYIIETENHSHVSSLVRYDLG